MKIRSVAVLAAVLGSSAIPAGAQQPDSAGTVFSFLPPTAVADFQMIGRQTLSTPGAGSVIRYQRPGAAHRIDVYVYPVARDSGCTTGCDAIAANRESDEFASLIPEMVSRGYYDSLRVDTDRRLELTAFGRSVQARHLVLRGGREGRAVTSQFYLVPGGPVLVKVRATYSPDADQDAAVEAFTQGFVGTALQTVNTCPGGPSQDRGLTMSVTVPQPLDKVRARVPEALRKLGYVLDPVPEADTWITRPVHEWPARDEWSRVRTSTHPGVQVMVEARAEGSKTEMAISARAICGLPGHHDIETATVLIAATEVVMQFPEREKP